MAKPLQFNREGVIVIIPTPDLVDETKVLGQLHALYGDSLPTTNRANGFNASGRKGTPHADEALAFSVN